jgi:hypothetical protein
MTIRYCLLCISSVFSVLSLRAQTNGYDLVSWFQTNQLTVENRMIYPFNENRMKGLRFSARPGDGDGVAWLNGIHFKNGTIELDIRDNNIIQESFVGIALHGLNKDSLEAIYFRPFNFHSTDSNTKAHSIEYVFHPDFRWERLCREHPGIYEKGIDPAPPSENWIHIKIVVHYPEIKVYVNNSGTPSLTVEELNNFPDGKLGLWVGNDAGGDFANLSIVNE